MNTKVSKSIVTKPPVWFITGCSTGYYNATKFAVEGLSEDVVRASSGQQPSNVGALA